jgi:hypothetical protein
MPRITRREFIGIAGTSIGGVYLGSSADLPTASPPARSLEALHAGFQEPDRGHSIRPFWFWNGRLDPEEIDRQIRQMVKHGVYGAYVHCRGGLETPYLSEEWWEAVGSALRSARENGFTLCMVDEFEWPSGEARDYWMPGQNKSRVVAANPDFRMRRLRPVEHTVRGPARAEIDLPEGATLVVTGKRLGPDRIEGDSLHVLAIGPGARNLFWEAPAGEFAVFVYVLEPTSTVDGSTVDLMNPEAVGKFIELYYEEFYRRHGRYFGATMPATFADHEGNYGGKLAWTPRLFETFRRSKGYDLERFLPGLDHDIGIKSEKVRCDYLDVVSELYSTSFFKQVNAWCQRHGLEYSGHVWEETLFFGPAYQGDFYRILRSMTNPGCDSLVEWGRQSVWLKEVSSVADFEGRRVVCENQGVQGSDSYLSPERMRRVSNCLGAWNVGEFVPHAFDYDLNRINFPPDWFRSQPFLPHFQAYADQMRRVSFMNCNSHHVAEILLYYPQVSVWGQAASAFRTDDPSTIMSNSTWSEDAVGTNSSYAQLKLRLSETRLDYKIADDSYLNESVVQEGALRISASRFRTLVLPPMSTMRRSSAERIAEFYQSGGTLIALGRLPTTSVENGRDDPVLKALWTSLFDTEPTVAPWTMRSNAKNGRAYFVSSSVDHAVALLAEITDHDVDVVAGPAEHLFILHKKKDGIDFYWVVNDTPEVRTNLLQFRTSGRPERWDAVSGKREPVFYETRGSSTLVRLTLNPWDASYIVFDSEGPSQLLELRATNLNEFYVVRSTAGEAIVRGRGAIGKEPAFVELRDGNKVYRGAYQPAAVSPLELSGEWTVTVNAPTILLPYAEAKDDPQDQGMRERWFEDHLADTRWNRLWLSPMNWALRKWNVIGPFPNPNDLGLQQHFPPEQEIDLERDYVGDAGRAVRWLSINKEDQSFPAHTQNGLEWGLVQENTGRYAPDSHIIDYGQTLRLDDPAAGTIFAQTWLYVSDAQDCVVVLATRSPYAVYVNAHQVDSKWYRPCAETYGELTDGFAFRIPVLLKAGWNSLLLKFLHNKAGFSATLTAFTCRVERRDGGHIRELLCSLQPISEERRQVTPGFRWLRFSVPPPARALRVPTLDGPWLAFVDGKGVDSAAELVFPPGTRTIVLRVSAAEILDRPFEAATAPTTLPLGTWSVPGLEHFSGSMTYEKTVDIPVTLLKERVLLDCGRVGVAAEIWVNDVYAGARPWQPFVLDVTDHLRPGPNRFKIRVANTEANARAVGEVIGLLEKIDQNGWVGPASLVPFIEREIHCVGH